MTSGAMYYGEFLLISILRERNNVVKEMPYDQQWEFGKTVYVDFFDSEYNRSDKGLYECIEDYLKGKIGNLTQLFNGQEQD